MTTSKTIAGLIGPTLVAIAASMLLNIGSFPALAEQVSPLRAARSTLCGPGRRNGPWLEQRNCAI
jgi:hypothetical protein